MLGLCLAEDLSILLSRCQKAVAVTREIIKDQPEVVDLLREVRKALMSRVGYKLAGGTLPVIFCLECRTYPALLSETKIYWR